MQKLKKFLDLTRHQFDQQTFLSSDPLFFAHQFTDPWDQEAVALLSAMLAYGRVEQVKKSITRVLDQIDALNLTPTAFVKSLEDPLFLKKNLKTFKMVHRFNNGSDILYLFCLLQQSWKKYQSLGAHFCSHLTAYSSIENALEGLLNDWTQWALVLNPAPSFWFFITKPSNKSTCKRWCMLLRWMGRFDKIDLGLWTKHHVFSKHFSTLTLHSSQLMMPLDTHTARLSQYLALTQKKSPNWQMTKEITNYLKLLNPLDPTCYDFSLSRLGILELCTKQYKKNICSQCSLYPVCTFTKVKS